MTTPPRPPSANGPTGPGPGPGPAAHPPAGVLDRYCRLGADDATAVSVEVHLQTCPECRAMVNAAVVPDRLAASWAMITAEIDTPRRSWLERLLGRVVAPDTVRLMAATPALRRSWYIAMAVALLFGLGAASPNRLDATVLWFLALAPLVPVIGVALAYGRGVDPSYEITLAAPMSGLRLVLVRAVAVVATSIVVTGVAALALGDSPDSHLAAAWLVPSLALSVVCLAASTVMAPRTAAWAVAVVWLAVVLAVSGWATDPLVVFRWWGQVAMVVVGLAGVAAVAIRRRSFDLVQGVR